MSNEQAKLSSDELFSDLDLLRASGFDDAANEIQRLRRELATQIHREKHAKCLRCGHGLFETTLPEAI